MRAPPAAGIRHDEVRVLEREKEVASIDKWLADARDGVGRMVLTLAGAGLGKSTLLGRAIALAQRHSVAVMSARGGELEREMPFGVARQLFEPAVSRLRDKDRDAVLDGAARHARSLLGLAADVTSGGDPLGVIHGLYWLLSNLAERSPLLVAIDDMHWIDVQTAKWLQYLSVRLADLPVLVLGAARPAEPGWDEIVAPLDQLHDSETLSPAPLGESAVAELVRTRLGRDIEPDFALACFQATGGNPFFLTELLRAVADDGLEPTAANAHVVPDLGTSEIARAIVVRLGRLGPDAARLAAAAAVLATDSTLPRAAILAGLERDRALDAWDALVRGEILQPSQPLEFIHPVVRGAIYRESAPGERTRAHRRAAGILDADGVAPERIAAHALACEPVGDSQVVGWLRTAAGSAVLTGAPDAAGRYLRRALAEPPPPRLRPTVEFELGQTLMGLDSSAAAESFGRAAQRMQGITGVEALRLQAYALGFAGRLKDAVSACERAITLAAPDREAALQLAGRRDFFVAWWPGDPDRAKRRHDLRRLAATLRGVTVGERQVIGAAAVSATHDGTVPAPQVLDLAKRLNRAQLNWLDRERDVTPGCLVSVALACDDGAAADFLEQHAIPECSAQGRLVDLSYALSWLAFARFREGALLDAEATARTAWQMMTAAGAVASVVLWCATATLTEILLARGEVAEAAAVLDRWNVSRESPMVGVFSWPELLAGQLLVAQGRLAEGVELLTETGTWLERRGYTNPTYNPWRARTAPVLATLGRLDEARELIGPGLRRARRFGAPWALGMALRAAGSVTRGDRGIELLREAVSVLEPSPCRLEHAHALLELGATLRRNNRRAEARDQLRAALAMAHGCGAEPVRERAEQELAATGARPRRVALTGLESLTASERRVAELAVAGASNRDIAQQLFVTRKTIETHLGHAYQKLGISSRRQLGDLLTKTRP
jgi:DNA-binding CsgD family transcriptional regulator